MVHADDNEVELLIRHLAEKYSGTFEREEIEESVARAQREVEEGASHGDFLPVFIQRRTEELLRERAGERDLDLGQVQQILFMDDRNTGRSQIAAAVANGKGDGLIRARSGGVAPGDTVQERILELLRERGYDAEEAEVNPMTGKAALASDVVVTMGLTEEEKQEMPSHGLHQIDWDDLGPIPDEASGADLGGVFDDIEARVDELVQALLHEEVGAREVDPEVSEELDRVIGDLHDPTTKD